MNPLKTYLIIALSLLIAGCSKKAKYDEKGFRVGPTAEQTEIAKEDGLNKDSLKFDTRPGDVLMTGIPNIRLTTVYKVNYNREKNTSFIGSNNFHYSYSDENDINSWNNNFMPGIEAVYGYNMVNVSHYNLKEDRQKNFFEKPVLIRTIYFPSSSADSLQGEPVNRQYFLVSVYNEDTNKDGFINLKDLRRFYLFDANGERKKPLIPENYSVFKSSYDYEYDIMYVYAQMDETGNGKADQEEPVHIFWIDLKNPDKTGRQY